MNDSKKIEKYIPDGLPFGKRHCKHPARSILYIEPHPSGFKSKLETWFKEHVQQKPLRREQIYADAYFAKRKRETKKLNP